MTVLDLKNAIIDKHLFFMDLGLDNACKKSRKGGMTMYSLLHAAKNKTFYLETVPKLAMYIVNPLAPYTTIMRD